MSELKDLQKAFTGHLRDPDHIPVPAGLDERRMGIYSELIFNNVSALLSDFFPVIHSVLDERTWSGLVRDFFITHQSQTPYFMELSGEFVEYLAQSQMAPRLPPWLIELAHYEWAELAVFTMEDELPARPVDTARLGSTPLSLSQLAWPLAYAYPVHRISPGFEPSTPAETYLLVARNAEDAVRFYELTPLTFQLLHEIQEKPGLIVEQWLAGAASRMQVEDPPGFISNGIASLQSFNELRLLTSGD